MGIRIQSISIVNIKFNTQKRIETEGNNGKDGKGLYKLMKNAIYSETMEDSRIKTDVKN